MPTLQITLTDGQLSTALRAFGLRNAAQLEAAFLEHVTGRVVGEEVNANVRTVSATETTRTRAALAADGWVLPE